MIQDISYDFNTRLQCVDEKLESGINPNISSSSITLDEKKERAQLLEAVNAAKQCLELCEMARKSTPQKIFRVGEVIANDDSDQVVVTTLADLFDVKKAVSNGTTTQLVGSMSDKAFMHWNEKRFAGRV